ncbi:MAG: HU family DNA-binding protein [Treponema sp.]|jgi:integration host factor subunit beta|nr:HU family DNA-binding protein [Treponema sp.]
MDGKKITKVDILDSIYQKTGMSRKEIREVVDLFLDDVKGALVRGVAVELRGFGTFEARIRKGRSRARNPKTGMPVSVNSHGVAAFRPGRELKRDVWRLSGGDPGGEAAPPGPPGNGLPGDSPEAPQSGAL